MNAIDMLKKNNEALETLLENHRKDIHLSVNMLSMKLQGICDAPVNGGLANYQVFAAALFASSSKYNLLLYFWA